MRRDDNPGGSGGARRIYRFHFGWSTAGRVNHFNLAAPPLQEPDCANSEVIQRTPGGSFPGNGSADLRTSGPSRSQRAHRCANAVGRRAGE
ncbi:hypothetical protein GO606_017555 [Aromatoleum anaerobium]|nr:hypothetical protein [Aromatoleum anaerobium]